MKSSIYRLRRVGQQITKYTKSYAKSVALGAVYALVIACLVSWLPFHQQTAHLHSYLFQNRFLLLVLVLLLIVVRVRPLLATARTFRSEYLVLISAVSSWLLTFSFFESWLHLIDIRMFRLRYAAVLGLVAAGFMALSYMPMLRPKRTDTKGVKFLSDDPDGDRNLTSSQKQMKDALIGIIQGQSPRSIALTGAWGVGKSKVVRAARNNQEVKANRDIIWATFEPWRYTSEEALVKGFYGTIWQAIDAELPGIQQGFADRISPSVDKLVDTNDKYGVFSFLLAMVKEKFGRQAQPEKMIAKVLEQEAKRLVVVIDDVDRQYDNKLIYRTLQLASFARAIASDKARSVTLVQLIMIFDKEAILAERPKHDLHPEDYMEKFFEVELPLAQNDAASIKEFLYRNAPQNMLPPAGAASPALFNDIGSFRAALRLVNQLLLMDRMFAKTNRNRKGFSFHEADVLTMTHIGLKYPLLWKDIDENREFYTQYAPGSAGYYAIRMRTDEDSQEKRAEKKRQHLQLLYKKMGLTVERQEAVESMLDDLFPDLHRVLQSVSSRFVTERQMRKDRRLGLLSMLDAYFGMSRGLTTILEHEKQAGVVLKLLLKRNNDTQVKNAMKKFIDYAMSLEHFADPLTYLIDDLLNDRAYVPLRQRFVRLWLQVVLGLEAQYDSRKTILLGRAFYVLQSVLRVEAQTEVQRQKIVQAIIGDKLLAKYSKTPWGSILMHRRSLSVDAREVGDLMTYEARNEFEVFTLGHLEAYYQTQHHDLGAEATRTGLFWSILEEWRQLAKSHGRTPQFLDYIQQMAARHPHMYLDSYTMRSYGSGRWVLRDEDEEDGIVSPVQELDAKSVKRLREVFAYLESSPHLTKDDQPRIELLREALKR